MDDLLKSWLEQVLAEELKGNALTLLEGGMPIDRVAEETGLTVEEIQKLAEEKNAEVQPANS